MRAVLSGMLGQTVRTIAQDRPNTIVSLTPTRVLVETETGHRNYASLRELQELANRVYSGEEVTVPLRRRSAFYMAVLVELPEVDFALNPRRVWLRDPPAAFDAEYSELFSDEEPARATEGRAAYRRHRVRERSPVLRRLKKEGVLAAVRRLVCEVCGFDYAERYGPIGQGYIECHHKIALAAEDERETTLEDLALVCASCHRMLHRSAPMMTIEELRARL